MAGAQGEVSCPEGDGEGLEPGKRVRVSSPGRTVARLAACQVLLLTNVGEPYARMVRAVSGWDMTVEELERVINLERLFNVREGVSRKDDVLPWRVMHEPIPDRPSAGMHCAPDDLSTMLDRCYALRGWDTDGVPTRERLNALGL